MKSQGKGDLSKFSNLIFKPKICAIRLNELPEWLKTCKPLETHHQLFRSLA